MLAGLARHQLAIAHTHTGANIQIGCLSVVEAVATAIFKADTDTVAGAGACFAFNDIARIGAANSAGNGSDFLATATADLMPEYTANNGAGYSAETRRLGRPE